MKQRRSTFAPLIMSLFLAGCGSLSPRPDPSKFFTLSSSFPAAKVAAKDPGGATVSLGIGPIKFPGYLDRHEIVLRTAQHRFEVSENERWAEPLDENFARVLGQNLAALLGTDRIISYPWPGDRKPILRVEIEVLSFEANAAYDAQLSARWVVLDGGTRKPLDLKVSRIVRPAKDKSIDGAVAALSEAVADLSREIADAVRNLEGRRK
jgi:uncharacterized lipoprotein YmbA